MIQSEQINELAAALSKAQLEYAPVHKDSLNPHYGSKYADLATVIAATQKALAKNGLTVTQWPCADNNVKEAGVISELAHSSGQWKRMELMLPATGKAKDGNTKYDAQTIGIAITYARRYSYQAIVGVAAELDDDANLISEPAGTKEAAKSVADRKIAEHKEKTAQKPAAASNGKNGHESPDGATVVLELIGEGQIALSGKGLAIVKSEMTADDRNYFNIRSHAGKWTMKADLADKFRDLCRRLNVGVIAVGNLPRGPHAPEKATIPPFTSPGKSDSTDPILMECVRVEKPGKKPYLDVTWDGRHHSSFDKGMWGQLETAKGLPVMLETKKNGNYSNIVRMLRCDGIDFTDDQNQTESGEVELGY